MNYPRFLFAAILACGIALPLSVKAQNAVVASNEIAAQAPAVVLNISSVSNLFDSLKQTAVKINEPAGMMILATGYAMVGADGPLGGFDLQKPISVVCPDVESLYAILPIKSFKALKKNFVEEEDAWEELDSGAIRFHKVEWEETLYLRELEEEKILFVSNKESCLPKKLSETVTEEIQKLSQQYVVGLKLNGAVGGESALTVNIDNLEMFCLDKIAENEQPETKACFNTVKILVQQACSKLRVLAKDEPVFQTGVALKNDDGIMFNAVLTAKADSDSANYFNGAQNQKTRFAGFYDSAAGFSLQYAMGKLRLLEPQQASELADELEKNVVQQAIEKRFADSPSVAQAAKELVKQFKPIFIQKLTENNLNGVIMLNPEAENGSFVLSACTVPSGEDAKALFYNIINVGAENNCSAMTLVQKHLQKNAAEFNGVSLDLISLPVSELFDSDDSAAEKIAALQKYLKSDSVQIAVAFGADFTAFSVGVNAVENLKTALSASQTPQKANLLSCQGNALSFIRAAIEYCPAAEKAAGQVKKFKRSMGSTYKNGKGCSYELKGVENGVEYNALISFDYIKTQMRLKNLQRD